MPLQLMVIAFPDGRLPAGVAGQLSASRANGVIRLIDGALLFKADEGEVTVRPVPELELDDSPLAGTLIATLFSEGSLQGSGHVPDPSGDVASMARYEFGIAADDLGEIIDTIPRASAVLVLLVEHRWNAGFAESVAVDRGTMLVQGWITRETVRAARMERETDPRSCPAPRNTSLEE